MPSRSSSHSRGKKGYIYNRPKIRCENEECQSWDCCYCRRSWPIVDYGEDRYWESHFNHILDEHCSMSTLVWVVAASGFLVSASSLWMSKISGLWPTSPFMTSMLKMIAVEGYLGTHGAFNKLAVADLFIWVTFFLSAGVFSASAVCILIKRKRVFWHEWIAIVLFLSLGAYLGVTPHEEFLVVLPLSTSIILVTTHLIYSSSRTGNSIEDGPRFGIDDHEDLESKVSSGTSCGKLSQPLPFGVVTS